MRVIKTKDRCDEIRMGAPDLGEKEVQAVVEVLRGSSLSRGRCLQQFQAAFAKVAGTNYAAGVSSGTAGLHVSTLAMGVREGDLVITTPFSFIASSNVILYANAFPVFVDVDPLTGNIDPSQVREAIEDLERRPDSPAAQRWLPPSLRQGRTRYRVKAVLPVHVYGQPADMDSICDVASEYSLAVIEDACEAIGACYKGRPAGSLGDIAVFGFYPNKQITTGEGGMVTTDRSELYELVRSLRNQGRDTNTEWLNHPRLGFNYRLDEMSSAIGTVQIGRLPELLANRAQVADWYAERLGDEELVEIPRVVDSTTLMSWFVYVVRIKPPLSRDSVKNSLQERGIPSRPYFSPIHLQQLYRDRFGYGPGDFPVTERLGQESLALPFSGVMTEEQVETVCEHLRYVIHHPS